MRSLCSLAVLLLLCGASASVADAATAPETFVLVAHPDVPRESLDKKTVSRIFLGKKTRWDGGLPVVPVVLREGDLHESFVEAMLDRTASKYEVFWKQAVFTGRGIPPRSFADEAELLAFVAATPGAVGYVSAGASLEGVKRVVCD